MFFKKATAGVLIAMVLLIVVLTMNIFTNTDYGNSLSQESQFLHEASETSAISSQSVYKTADNIYDKDIYFENIKSYEAIILPYNADLDKNYMPDTLFIGDSNTAGLYSFGYLPLQNVLGKPSMAIQMVKTKEFVWFSGYDAPLNIIKSVSLLKPRRIIINFGTNNTVGTSVKDFTAIYKSSLIEIKNAYPYSDIIVSAVLPVGKSRENMRIKMQTIDSFNLALAQICADDGYKFLNTAEVFKDSDTGFMKAKYVANDGVHLNNTGYAILLEYMADHKLMTVDRRPPRGFIPKRLETGVIGTTTPPEYDLEPGEEVIFPPSAEDNMSSSLQSSVATGSTTNSDQHSIASGNSTQQSDGDASKSDSSADDEIYVNDPFS